MQEMESERRSPGFPIFPALIFVCAFLVVPAASFHLHVDGHAHADCPICLSAFIIAELTPPALPAIVFYGFHPLLLQPLTGLLQIVFTGSNQLSCGPPGD
jgi:hypothetical protein